MPIWPFGRKKKQPRVTVSFDEMFAASREYRREIEAFDASKQGRAIRRHYELVNELNDAPASQKERIARDMVAIADGVRDGLKVQHEQTARYMKREGRPHRDFALPRHTGFQQLAIIQEREKRYDEAVATCHEAKRQGWGGDWDKRLERIAKKRSK